jgi:UDPglucose 6-dehydrogenase
MLPLIVTDNEAETMENKQQRMTTENRKVKTENRKEEMKITKICCIGAGYVGGPTMAIIAQKCPAIQVTVVDLNEERIAAWNDEDVDNIPVTNRVVGVLKEARGRNLFFYRCGKGN